MTESKLQEICSAKYEHIAKLKKEIPLAEMEERAKAAAPVRGFEKALRTKESEGRFAVIAEIKKASPSKGVLRMDFDPVHLAKGYEAGGATAISVLTDEPFFMGKNEDLIAARNATNLPVLRKDFILDPYQVYESRAIGADAILLIMAAVGDEQAFDIEEAARNLGMDVLIEVHNREEVFRALTLSSYLIGVNNRDLTSLKVDLNTGKNLSRYIPGSYLRICESGIKTNKDMLEFRRYWYNSFLIGEALMTDKDVTTTLKLILG